MKARKGDLISNYPSHYSLCILCTEESITDLPFIIPFIGTVHSIVTMHHSPVKASVL